MLRAFVRGWIRLALWFRFRKIQVVHHSPLSTGGPAIIAGNHQNGILDSMTMASCCPKVPYTLSRASLFENGLARRILESLRMLPIYRFRDGFGGMRKNAKLFRSFVEVLNNNEWLLVFPEGSHFLRHVLRPLQKGTARIALAAQVEQNWDGEIPIFPVGLQYESHTAFGSRLLIQFGPPVSTLAFQELHSRDPKEAERSLTRELIEGMRRLLIVLPADDEAYEKALRIWEGNKGRFPDLMEQFRSDRKLLGDLDLRGAGGNPGAGMIPRGKAMRKLGGYALSLPGVILHLPVLLATLAWDWAFLEDLHLVPAARFALGMVLVPLWYLAAVALWHAQFGSISLNLVPLAVLPGSLWLWSRCWHWTRA